MQIYQEKKNSKWNIIEIIITLFVNALVLKMATAVFNNFHISNFTYAFLAALIIMILNQTIKPFIKMLTLPLTIYTLGLSYPLVNVIILKITGLLLSPNFVIAGWIVPFFISIFISIFTIILDILITKQIIGGQR